MATIFVGWVGDHRIAVGPGRDPDSDVGMDAVVGLLHAPTADGHLFPWNPDFDLT